MLKSRGVTRRVARATASHAEAEINVSGHGNGSRTIARHEQDLEVVVNEVLQEDAGATAPHLLACNTPEFYNNDEEIDCDTPRK